MVQFIPKNFNNPDGIYPDVKGEEEEEVDLRVGLEDGFSEGIGPLVPNEGRPFNEADWWWLDIPFPVGTNGTEEVDVDVLGNEWVDNEEEVPPIPFVGKEGVDVVSTWAPIDEDEWFDEELADGWICGEAIEEIQQSFVNAKGNVDTMDKDGGFEDVDDVEEGVVRFPLANNPFIPVPFP